MKRETRQKSNSINSVQSHLLVDLDCWALLVGNSFAKSLSMTLGIPLIEVNHMQAHILAHFIDDANESLQNFLLCLTVSGGHTQIVKVNDYFEMEVLGETLDDAAGEAFDKSGKF